MVSSVTFPSEYGGDGQTYTDDADPNTGLDGLGYMARFVPCLAGSVAMAGHAQDRAAAASSFAEACQQLRDQSSQSASAAADSADAAAQSAASASEDRGHVEAARNELDADRIVHTPGSGLPNQAGALALLNRLSDAPIGDLLSLLSSMGLENVFNTDTSPPWPNARLDDPEGVTSNFYYVGGDIPDRPTTAYGHILHLNGSFGKKYQYFFNGFNSRGAAGTFSRFINSDGEGWPTGVPWAGYVQFDTSVDSSEGDAVLRLIGDASQANALGVPTMAVNNSSTWHGNLVSGSSLTPCGVTSAGGVASGDNGTPLTGTWRCMGRGASGDATVWVKVAE